MPLFLAMLREQTAANPARMTRALAGLRKYQEAPRSDPPPPKPVLATCHNAALRDYGGDGLPVLFVPSLINPPNILDLSEERSLLRRLAREGRRVLLLDWGWPDDGRKPMDVAAHVERIAVPLIAGLPEPPDLVGYCLGGTMAAAAAQLTPVRSLVTIATPWHFSAYPEPARADLQRLWSQVQPSVETLGLLPMEALQSAFWNLDPARTIAKFESFADLEGDEARAFVTLEDWANDGPPLSEAAAREMFEDFFAADRPGRGLWRVGGQTIDPSGLDVPLLNIVSATDRIVPSSTAIRAGDHIELSQGHVGMVVGSARERLWKALSDWLSRTAANC
ncbi:MAG TPA: alpha/beta fold hydrolase [Allosphingosinicella sp.]|nr:alpha/beta fold hydrolase [Allosphingosinicella sp.]